MSVYNKLQNSGIIQLLLDTDAQAPVTLVSSD